MRDVRQVSKDFFFCSFKVYKEHEVKNKLRRYYSFKKLSHCRNCDGTA